MSFINKFAWSGAAVVLAVVLALGLMGQSAAAATTVTGTGATTLAAVTGNGTGTGTYTSLSSNIVLTYTAAADIGIGNIVIAAPSGWTFNGAITADVTTTGGTVATTPATYTDSSNVACTTNCAKMKIAITTANNGAGALTIGATTKPQVRQSGNTTSSGNMTLDSATTSAVVGLNVGATIGTLTTTAYGTSASPYTITLQYVTGTTNCGTTSPVSPLTASVAADGSVANALCATVVDTNGKPQVGVTVTFTVSQGVVSTGSSKTTTSITNTAGHASTNYRGGGNVAGSDTAVASNTSLNAVGTLTIALTAATGTTASKVVLIAPSVLALGQTIATTTPNYQAPTGAIGTFMAAQVQDASGLGVNSQTILVSTDKGFLVASPAFGVTIATACGANGQGGTAVSKSITLTTAGTDKLTSGGAVTPGAADFILCPVTSTQVDAPGKATITVSNISTVMANATSSVTIANRPAKITATATGNSITATVVDSAGNVVADGTPIRFTISSNAGAVSVTCTTSTNGVASSVVALIAASGTVIVSSDWSETVGTQASCSSAGAQQIAASVRVPGGTSTGGTTPPTGGAGAISSGSIPAGGGFGLIVASGDIKGVVTALGCPSASMALWATVNGNFVTYVPGTSVTAVNADFMAAFPGGILPAATPLIGKCK